MSATTRTFPEYGLKGLSGSITWPDEDGDLDFRSGYLRAAGDGVDVDELQRRAEREGYVLVKRSVTRTESAPEIVSQPLPKGFGSIILATIGGGVRERLAYVDPTDADMPWRSESGMWVRTSSLSEIEVLFDAKEVAA